MKHFKNLVKPYFVWSLLLIVIPLVLIVLYAFTNGGNEVRTLNFYIFQFCPVPGTHLPERVFKVL